MVNLGIAVCPLWAEVEIGAACSGHRRFAKRLHSKTMGWHCKRCVSRPSRAARAAQRRGRTQESGRSLIWAALGVAG